jgi:hypothetical protein
VRRRSGSRCQCGAQALGKGAERFQRPDLERRA